MNNLVIKIYFPASQSSKKFISWIHWTEEMSEQLDEKSKTANY